jgi:hypothetical protein
VSQWDLDIALFSWSETTSEHHPASNHPKLPAAKGKSFAASGDMSYFS